MHRFRCPRCSRKLEIARLFDGRHLIQCNSCSLIHVLHASVRHFDDAYLRLLEDYDDGLIPADSPESVLEREGLVRRFKDVEELLESNGVSVDELPAVVRRVLFSRTDYLVSYRLLEKEEPPQVKDSEQISVSPELSKALRIMGISTLYAFQAEAFREILSGKNVVIVAPTGSGKTEAFALPLFEKLTFEKAREGGGGGNVRALFIYPTKALSRDQLPKLQTLAETVNLRVAVFDGDTPTSQRNRIISDPPDAIITNFDSIHAHLLFRTSFAELLESVRYVVVDEAHVYTGTFGSNVHHILKRLRRVCGGFQAIAASATLRNPKEYCDMLFDAPFSVVYESAGKRGRIHFAMLFPSLRSHRSLVLELLKLLTSSGHKPLVFSSSHLGAELNAFYGRKQGINIAVHRAGLRPTLRKKVEEEFKNGSISAVSATPTLELGIDIGSVDSVISDLTTVTRLIQRTGRAGRRGQESIVFLVLRGNDPISQYYVRHYEDYFEDTDQAFLDPANPIVAEMQVLAAALDKPLDLGEYKEFQDSLNSLIAKGLLRKEGGRIIPEYAKVRSMLRGYDIRGSGDSASIFFQGRSIGERSMPIAIEELHPEAIYFLGGIRYRSLSFDFIGRRGRVSVEKVAPNYPFYTRPLLEEWPTVIRIIEKRRILGMEVAYADLSILKRVVGYANLQIGSEEKMGSTSTLSNPLEYEFKTKGMVLRAPEPTEATREASVHGIEEPVGSSYHAAEHVLIEGTNMVTGGAGADMGGISLGSTGLIFVYDSSVGGNGATRLLFEKFGDALSRTQKILRDCSCHTARGCPRCTYSYRCGNNNNFLYRIGGLEVTDAMLKGANTILEPFPLRGLERSFV